MKHLRTITYLITILSFFYSCEQSSYIKENKSMKVSDFAYMGDIHNLYLKTYRANKDKSQENFDNSQKLDAKKEIFDFCIKMSNKTNQDNSNKEKLSESFKKNTEIIAFPIIAYNRNNVKTRNAAHTLNDDSIENMLNDSIIEINNTSDIIYLSDYAYRHKMIDYETYDFFNQILNLIESSIEDTLRNTKQDLCALTEKIDNQKYLRSDSSMLISGPVLSIANASCNFWTEEIKKECENCDSLYFTEEEVDSIVRQNLPPFVYSDVGGAAVGAIQSAYSQYKKNGKVTSYGNIGKDALSGAILSSLGADMFFGKFLINGTIRLLKPCSDAFWKIIFKLF